MDTFLIRPFPTLCSLLLYCSPASASAIACSIWHSSACRPAALVASAPRVAQAASMICSRSAEDVPGIAKPNRSQIALRTLLCGGERSAVWPVAAWLRALRRSWTSPRCFPDGGRAPGAPGLGTAS